MNNLINAFTNFPFAFAALAAEDDGDPTTGKFIINSGMASIIYHLFGNSNIIEANEDMSYYFNITAENCMGILIVRLLYVYYKRYGFSINYFAKHIWFTICLIFSFGCNLISEYYMPIAENSTLYTIVHSLWHLSIFMLIWYFVVTK